MNVVVDANLIAALVLPLSYSERAAAKMTAWKRAGVTLLAPLLIEYEVSALLRRAVAAGLLSAETADQAMDRVLGLYIQGRPPTGELHRRAVWWAAQLGHSKTYDAHYKVMYHAMYISNG